ncbi:MAG: tyramine oxidase subunit B [Pygmaiobacter massiliensis]|nr:tyramine oxidase subunit B [Pygmaiobacter massiliensis]
MSLDFLYLDEPSMLKAGVLDMKRCVQSIDDMFRTMGEGDYLMGSPSENHHGMMLWFPVEHRAGKMPVAGPDRRFMAMPAYLGGRFYVCGNKWYGSNVANKEKGLPRSVLTMMLNDVDTGAPIALMSANLLSSMRTGAVPGVATKYLQRKGASVAAIIGAGVVSRSCLLGLSETIDVKGEAKVYDLFFDKAQKFCEEMQSQTPLKLRPVETLEEAVCGSDVISVAASGLAPVDIKDEWIKPGSVFLATGAANFSDEAYDKYNVVFDNWKMHKDWLDELRDEPERLLGVNAGHPSATLLLKVAYGKADGNKMMSLGDIIADPSKGRKSDDDVFLFLTGGMGTEDVAWGYDVYCEAVKQGLGQKLSLWDKPHWA